MQFSRLENHFWVILILKIPFLARSDIWMQIINRANFSSNGSDNNSAIVQKQFVDCMAMEQKRSREIVELDICIFHEDTKLSPMPLL